MNSCRHEPLFSPKMPILIKQIITTYVNNNYGIKLKLSKHDKNSSIMCNTTA